MPGAVAALALAAVWAGAALADEERPRLARSAVESGGAFAPGEAIVRFERGATPGERQAARQAARVDFDSTIGLPHAQLVEVEGNVGAAVRRLEGQPGVAYAQPNYRYEATAVEPPNDTFFEDLWGLGEPMGPEAGVYALEAWENNKGAGQVIAVLDTGVDLSHPDLAPNLWEDPSGDHGHDFVDGDDDPDDFNYHGTHVAGTAAAVDANEEGIAGVAPEAEIMAVRVLDGDGSGFTNDIAAGIDFAAENGADVINMSLGGPAGGGDKAMSDAIAEAGEDGAITVVAAGNEAADNDTEPHTPCALPNPTMICVAALSRATGALAGFSNYGEKSVDLAAPGTSILSAKTDYGAPVFEEGFEGGLGLWTTETFNGGLPWGESSSAPVGEKSATDSPSGDYGPPEDPEEFSYSELFTTAAVNLAAERGCRVHFRTRYEIEEFFDGFFAGAIDESPAFDGIVLDGTSPGFGGGSFVREEASVSDFDGGTDVHPIFAVVADETEERDGAYVDDVRLICRDGTYVDAEATGGNYDQPESGNYVRFQGTSMATPHVAGVVALVGAAVDDAELELAPEQIVGAVLAGTSTMPSPDSKRPTATSGIADACKAIAVATEQNFEEVCPASSVPEEPEPPEEEEDEPSSSDDSSEAGAPPPAVPPPPIAAPDLVAPHTFIKKRPRKVVFTPWRRGRAVFKFRSNEAGVLFFCQFDRKRWRRCGPRFVRWFLAGRHVLRVKARDAAGNVDPTPAVYRFRVRRVSKKQFVRLKRASRRARRDRR